MLVWVIVTIPHMTFNSAVSIDFAVMLINRRSSSGSWGLLAIAIVVLLLLTLPRLPQAPDNPSLPQCVPAEKVGFAKTHKTASSTVQNIFLRWGLNQDWNFALLTSGSHLGPPNNQYVLNQPFQVLCKTFCKCHPIFLPGFLVERSTLGGYG